MQTMILMKVVPHLDDYTAFGWWLKGMIRGEKNAGTPSAEMGSTLGVLHWSTPATKRNTCRGQMGCKGPNYVTMGAQNNLQQQVRVAGVGVRSRSLKMVEEVQGLVQEPGCT